MQGIYISILLTIGFFSTSLYASNPPENFVLCDSCNANKAKIQAIVSGYEGIVNVGDLDYGIMRTYNVVESTLGGETIPSATLITSNTTTLTKFNSLLTAYSAVTDGTFAVDSSVINSGWELLSDVSAGNQVIDYVKNNYDTTLKAKVVDYFNVLSSLTPISKPMNIKIATPDGGFLIYTITALTFDGEGFSFIGDFDLEHSQDGNHNPLVVPGSGRQIAFGGGASSSALTGFVNHVTRSFNLSWNGGSGTGSSGGITTTMVCRPVGDETVCVITIQQ